MHTADSDENHRQPDAVELGQSKPLLPHHVEHLKRSGWTEDAMVKLGVYTEQDSGRVADGLGRPQSFAEQLGSCLVFPYPGVTGFVRMRPDKPRPAGPAPKKEKLGDVCGHNYAYVEPEAPRKFIKYESPLDGGTHMYVPLALCPSIADPEEMLYLSEGEKKAGLGCQEGAPCIGLPGVDGAHDVQARLRAQDVGGDQWVLHAELKPYVLPGREVCILFDTPDMEDNLDVIRAAVRTARMVDKVDALARVGYIPTVAGLEKVGLDDYFVAIRRMYAENWNRPDHRPLKGDFAGARPAHPNELLDWLVEQKKENGWKADDLRRELRRAATWTFVWHERSRQDFKKWCGRAAKKFFVTSQEVADLAAHLGKQRDTNAEDVDGKLWTDELAYVVPTESYYYKLPGGSWNIKQPIAAPAAVRHLLAMKVPKAGETVGKNRMAIAHGIDCCPGEPATVERDGRKLLNCYAPPNVVPAKGEYPSIRRILSWATGHDDKAVAYIINWLAFKVQNPASRNLTCLVLQAKNGTGKGTFTRVVKRILGEENVVAIGQGDIESSFNGHFATKLLVIADEVVTRDNAIDTSGPLKQYITEPVVSVNAKFVQPMNMPNRGSWIFTSNSSTPVRIEGSDDRRYNVFCNPNPPSPEHKAMLLSLFTMTNEFTEAFAVEVAAFAYDLHHHPVDFDLVRQVYENEARSDLARASRTAVQAFADEIVERGIDVFVEDDDTLDVDGPAVKTDAVYKAYRYFCDRNGYKAANESNFGKELRQKLPGVERKRATTGERPWCYKRLPRTRGPIVRDHRSEQSRQLDAMMERAAVPPSQPS